MQTVAPHPGLHGIVRVLVVDEPVEAVRTIRESLQPNGDFHVHGARTLSDARELLKSGAFDIALVNDLTWRSPSFRAAYRAAYINYDNAKEYLVYAHSTRDMKDVLEQVETISKRLYGDKSIAVAYDNDALYPFWWYLRDYPNKVWFGDNITKDLRNSPVILVGSANFAKIEPLVRDDYIMYEYKRMWWPMEAYRNQSIASVWQMLKNPALRAGLWDIWFNQLIISKTAVKKGFCRRKHLVLIGII